MKIQMTDKDNIDDIIPKKVINNTFIAYLFILIAKRDARDCCRVYDIC